EACVQRSSPRCVYCPQDLARRILDREIRTSPVAHHRSQWLVIGGMNRPLPTDRQAMAANGTNDIARLVEHRDPGSQQRQTAAERQQRRRPLGPFDDYRRREDVATE